MTGPKPPASSRAPVVTLDLAALVFATPDEQAVVLALSWLDWWLGIKVPKGLKLILAVLKGLPQLYGKEKPRALKHISETQAKRAIASLRARAWLRTSRGDFGDITAYSLCIPRMELDEAKDLLVSRLSPEVLEKLQIKSIEARAARLAPPAYEAKALPPPGAVQEGLFEDSAEEKAKKAERAAAGARAALANQLEDVWAELWGGKYGELVLKATGRERGVFNNFAREGVDADLFRAKVAAYLLQADDYIITHRHSLHLLKSRWYQLGGRPAAAAACTHPWEQFQVETDYGLNVDGRCKGCNKSMTRGKP